jgi:hypothetical protein
MQDDIIINNTEQSIIVNNEVETSIVSADSPKVDLNEESLALISQIIAEKDEQKARDLTYLFNANQNKKTMVRVNKLSDLLDTITDQALARFTARPDEISNKELFDGLKVVQDLIERGQKQVSGTNVEMPLIQVNQQNNEVNVGNVAGSLSRDSRERVKSAVLGLLDSLVTKQNSQDTEPIVVTEAIEDIQDGENT